MRREQMTGSMPSPTDWRRAFTLVEVLAVITIIAILLGVSALALKPSGESARRAARGEILGMLTRARSHAISSGNPSAMVVVRTVVSGGGDKEDKVWTEMKDRSMNVVDVSWDEDSQVWTGKEPTSRWVDLPKKILLLDGAEADRSGSIGANFLEEPVTLPGVVLGTVAERQSGGGGDSVQVEYSFVVFDPTGAVLHPSGSGRIEFVIGEGVWRNRQLTVTRRLDDGSAVADRVVLSRLSGRAQSVESGAGS